MGRRPATGESHTAAIGPSRRERHAALFRDRVHLIPSGAGAARPWPSDPAGVPRRVPVPTRAPPAGGNRMAPRRALVLATLALVPLLARAGGPAAAAQAAGPLAQAPVTLPGHVLAALPAARPQAVAPSAAVGTPLTLTITLNRTDPVGFAAYLRALYDPAAPDFRRFASPAELAARFGPSAAAYAA